jgi:hypothetical protein
MSDIFQGISLQPGLQIPIVLPPQGRLGSYTLRQVDYDTLSRFQDRTASTLGTLSTRKWYLKVVSGLAKEVCLSILHCPLAIPYLPL